MYFHRFYQNCYYYLRISYIVEVESYFVPLKRNVFSLFLGGNGRFKGLLDAP